MFGGRSCCRFDWRADFDRRCFRVIDIVTLRQLVIQIGGYERFVVYVVGPKGWAVRPLKRHASWVQNVVRQFGLYLVFSDLALLGCLKKNTR